MFKNLDDKNIEVKKLNEVISLSSKILKIAYFFILILAIYSVTLIFQMWGILAFLLTILKVISPFFIGLIFAWLLNPAVTYLQKKNINRVVGTIIVYITLIMGFYVLLSGIIPLLTSQLNEFINTMPNIVETLKDWVEGVIGRFGNLDNPNVVAFKEESFAIIDQTSKELTKNLPQTTVSAITSFVSGVGVLLIGMLIGFFMLFNFDNVSSALFAAIPRKFKKDTIELLARMDNTLKHFVKGVFTIAFLVFVISSIVFAIIGLQAPLLFGLFCGLTNIIPFVGPYIGGSVAVIVGLIQSPTIGILIFLSIVVIQLIESNFLQPLIMSRAVKIHPVSIIIGLLIFGYFFGIIGLIIATPIIAIVKLVAIFLNEKFELFHLNGK